MDDIHNFDFIASLIFVHYEIICSGNWVWQHLGELFWSIMGFYVASTNSHLVTFLQCKMCLLQCHYCDHRLSNTEKNYRFIIFLMHVMLQGIQMNFLISSPTKGLMKCVGSSDLHRDCVDCNTATEMKSQKRKLYAVCFDDSSELLTPAK